MSPLTLAGIAVTVLAVLLLCFGLPDSWFFALLSLACALGSASEAYHEHELRGIGLLILAAMMAGASLRSVIGARRTSGGDA